MARGARYGNRGAARSRMSSYGARDRNWRFKKYGARGKWRTSGYKLGKSVQFKPSRRRSFKKRSKPSRNFGGAGDSSFVTLSALGRRRRFLGAVEKALASKTVYEVVSSARHEGNTNQQGITWIPVCFPDDLKAAFATSTGTTPNEGGKVYIEYVLMRLQCVNQTNVPVSMWVYDVMLRRDLQVSPQLSGDWDRGIRAQGGTTGDYLLPFSTPFKSNRFCSQYLIRRVTKVLLAPGETHVHTLKLSVYSAIPQSRLYSITDAAASGSVGLGGLSHAIGIVTLGGVINAEATQTNVGYAPHAVDLAWTTSYRVAALFDDKVRYSKSSTLSPIEAPKTMVEVDADPSDVIEI